MAKKDWNRKVAQVVWEDCRPWVEQLWKHHGVLVAFKISIVPTGSGVKPGVTLECYKRGRKAAEPTLDGRWQTFDATVEGGAARAGLQLVSRLLLDLDNGEAKAERDAVW